jgi:hypothetical protein
MSIESEGRHCQQLNECWEETIKDVRIFPGFEDFMRPKAINALKQAAVLGPIIIPSVTYSTCCALIVTTTNKVQYLKLPEMNPLFAQFLADLVGAVSGQAFELGTFLARYQDSAHTEEGSELLDRLFGSRERSINLDPDDVFREVLTCLWKEIVKPVFDHLKLEASIIFSVDHILSYIPVEIS